MRRAYLLGLFLALVPAAACTADPPVGAPAGPTPLPIVSGVEVSEVDALWQGKLWTVERHDSTIAFSLSIATDYDQSEKITLSFADANEPALVSARAVVSSMGEPISYDLSPDSIRLARFRRDSVIAGDLVDALHRKVRFWVDAGTPIVERNAGTELEAAFDLVPGVVMRWREVGIQLLQVTGCGTDPASASIYVHGFESPFDTAGPIGIRYFNLVSGEAAVEATYSRGISTYKFALSVTIDCGTDADSPGARVAFSGSATPVR